ncbi:hypothetical protein MGALJ_10020 [Mycobacterium gallinarum]|uniref:Uncharacterized protein n=1 Tax=Mycobacterium gallinarum TaxID=39689 RepID=A0A9W4AZD9_9MYCO|nr:hypothetical protein [Mycobacterium gallinarum]BBY91333.1 hypothetical protein MGALJ_10020 [Mycobacterium gallinarum]
MTTDRMGLALATVSLIEKPDDNAVADALMPDNLDDTQTMLATAVTAAHMLASQLALHLEVDRADVLAVLRHDVADCFQQPKENNDD